MDLFLFLTTLYAFIMNAVGVRSLSGEALATARVRFRKSISDFMVWMSRNIARPMSTFIWTCCVGLTGVVALASYVHFSVIEKGVGDGKYLFFLVTSTVSIVVGSVWAFYQRRWGNEQPLLDGDGNPVMEDVFLPAPNGEGPPERIGQLPVTNPDYRPNKVSFFVSGGILTFAMLAVSISLSLHALSVESRALWLISMMTRYAGFVVIAGVLSVLAWIVRRGGGFLERSLQIAIETFAPLLGGITYANVRERLFPNGLNLLEEVEDAIKIAAITVGLYIVVAPFDILIFFNPTNDWTVVIGAPYLVTLILGQALRFVPHLRGTVDEARDRFLKLMFKLGWIITLIIMVMTVYLTNTRLGIAILRRLVESYNWLVSIVDGNTYLIENHGFWTPFTLFFIALGAALLARSVVPAGMYLRKLAIGIPATLVVWCLAWMAVAVTGKPGWTPFPTTEAQEAMMEKDAPKPRDHFDLNLNINKKSSTSPATTTTVIVNPPTVTTIVVKQPPRTPPSRVAKSDAEVRKDFDELAEDLNVE
ncbi:MAG: hypothetical protein WC787_05190 [Patescibacteria group bacterium]|jgi:hypothetical protein